MNAEAQEAVDNASKYEFGWSSDIEQDFAPKGLNEGTVRFISDKKGRTGMDARMAPQGLSHVAGNGISGLGQARHSDDRLSGCLLLCRAQEKAGAGDSSTNSIR